MFFSSKMFFAQTDSTAEDGPLYICFMFYRIVTTNIIVGNEHRMTVEIYITLSICLATLTH